MNFFSQAGQDQWVVAVLGDIRNGRFIDVGASHPVEINNTFAVESQLGWSGILVDSSESSIELCRDQRKSPAICCDAVGCDWPFLIGRHQPTWEPHPVIDFASVDIDEWTHGALVNLMKHMTPKVVTLEHDAYQRGDRLRIPNRQLMEKLGYDLVAADVLSNGCAYEDWHCHPSWVDRKYYDRFRSVGLDWKDVLRQGGAL